MTVFDVITQYSKMLKNLRAWLDKAAAYANQEGFDPDVLAVARLAPTSTTSSRSAGAVSL